ncbi:hypothetical protein FOA52_013648 [Chlamydomonas sp. UWO 241]|nr:hypothetical protein FOA52_013648 [Chlamydomonas sp. UWO 241]
MQKSSGAPSSRSRYVGVSWDKSKSAWEVRLTDLQTKRSRRIGRYVSEKDAARAYDCAVVRARGAGALRNFPGEAISELPVTVGEERKQRSSSRFIGVSWNKAMSAWVVQLTDPQTKRKRGIGFYASEEDAARAYDCAAVQARGPGVKRNFPGEVISEMPVAVGEERRVERKQGSSSRYIGVYWHKSNSVWLVQLWDPQAKRVRHIGSYASEEDAARAYDCAAVQVHGPGAKRNFPADEAAATSKPPVSQRS